MNVLVRETKEDTPRVSKPLVNLEKILTRFTKSKKEVIVKDLQQEIKETKSKVKTLKEEVTKLSQDLTILKIDHSFLDQKMAHQSGSSHHNDGEDDIPDLPSKEEEPANLEALEAFLKTISRINFQKWHSKVKIVISKEFEFEVVAPIDSGVDLNCIQEGIIPTKYFVKTKETLSSTNGSKMKIKYKFPKAHVCQNNTCFKTPFVLVKDMTDKVILGNLFMCFQCPFTMDNEGITTHPFRQPIKFSFLRSPEPREINVLQDISISKMLNLINKKIQHLEYLKVDLNYRWIEEQLENKTLMRRIALFEEKLKQEVYSDLFTAFWHRKRHVVSLPYVKNFKEKEIPTKARPIQISQELIGFCKTVIEDLVSKNIIRKSKYHGLALHSMSKKML